LWDDRPTTKAAELHSTRHPQKEHNGKAQETTTPAPSKPAADGNKKTRNAYPHNTKKQEDRKNKKKKTKQKQGKKPNHRHEENTENEKITRGKTNQKTTGKNPTNKTDHQPNQQDSPPTQLSKTINIKR